MTHAVSPSGSPSASPRGLPIVSDTLLPADVRSGSASDKQHYKAALGFEQMLVGQLVQTMTGSAGAPSGDDDESAALDTANPLASGPMASQMQDALTSALMSAGGLGLAGQIYKGMQAS